MAGRASGGPAQRADRRHHDRWFLDTVATRTWEVHSAASTSTKVVTTTGFSRAERVRLSDAAEERRRNLARKELAVAASRAAGTNVKPTLPDRGRRS